MPHLTPTQREAFDTYTALYKERGIQKKYADTLFLAATGFAQVPYFMDLPDEVAERVTRLLKPEHLRFVAARLGDETGVCAICGKELTDPESVERGIGPVCAGKLTQPKTLKDLL